MTRRLFTLVAVGSAVLCVAFCALWVRSHFRIDTVWHLSRPQGDFGYSVVQFHVADGELRTDRIAGAAYRLYEPAGFGHRVEPLFALNSPPKTVAGFAYRESSRSVPFYSEQRTTWVVPIWSLAVLFAVLPVIWLAGRLARRRRNSTGECPACGYDLRATPGVCPECGAVPAMKGERA